MTRLRQLALCLAIAVGAVCRVHAADLQPATIAAFDRYVATTEARASFGSGLWLDTLSANAQREALDELRAGKAITEKLKTTEAGRDIDVPDGLIHHWVGTVFVPGKSTSDAVQLLQDYDRHAEFFAPLIQQSRILTREDDHFTVFLRFYEKKGVTVVVNSDHDARFTQLADGQVFARIVSTRIQEVEDPGGPAEREKAVGQDNGYLWRLNTYWHLVERDGGVYVQCESITLTRPIPFGLGWLIGPFVTGIPRESLTFTLDRARSTLLQDPP